MDHSTYAITENGFEPIEGPNREPETVGQIFKRVIDKYKARDSVLEDDDNTEQFLFEDLKRAHNILKDAKLAEAQARAKREAAEKMFHARVWRYVDHTHAQAKGLL